MKNLDEGIYGAIMPWANLTGGLWKCEAPKGQAYPHAVFKEIDNATERTYTEREHNVAMQVTIADDSKSALSINNLAEELGTEMDEVTLTVTGWLNAYSKVISENCFKQSGVWYYAFTFEITFDKGV